jgi:hypothetical protein
LFASSTAKKLLSGGGSYSAASHANAMAGYLFGSAGEWMVVSSCEVQDLYGKTPASEKRFVAIVAVEGQEFLIGGGVSGMSLLAQLGSVGGGTSEMGKKTSDSGCAL